MIEVGQICMKIAGRDAGKLGVIIEILDDTFVTMDGEVRRRKVNIKHIEPIMKKVDIKSKASSSEVLKALGIEEKKKSKKDRKDKGPRPKKQRNSKKEVKKEIKKPAKKKTKEGKK